MPKPIPATLRFEDAPDMINIQQLADMLGVCHREASKLFNSKGFPVVSRMNGKKIAYKYDVAKFLGIYFAIISSFAAFSGKLNMQLNRI